MYIDVNGKRGYRQLMGTSGKTYGNAKLLNETEKTAMLADGIQVAPVVVNPGPTPEQLESRRKRQIRAVAMDRVSYHLLGDIDEGEDQLTRTLLDLTLALTETVADLISENVITPASLNQRIKDLNGLATTVKTARQAALDAINNDDDLETFNTALDAIIPPPPGP